MKLFQVALLLLIAACRIHCENSDAESHDNLVSENVETSFLSKGDSVTEATKIMHDSNSTSSSSNSSDAVTDEIAKAAENSSQHDLVSAVQNASKPSNLQQKREIENFISNEIKPFLLFPTLPFMLPEKESDSGNSNGLKSAHHDSTPNDPKPFIFFKFSVNIRQIPLANGSESLNDSKIINVKKLESKELPKDNLKKSSKSDGRKRRNTSNKDSSDFFDNFPLFPTGNIDEFFPKPDFFFPDMLFHRKPSRKSNRKKRDMKKSGLKNDLKFFLDIFDEAFTKTKRDLELTNPFFDLIRDGNEAKNNRKSGDVFNEFSLVDNLKSSNGAKVYGDQEIAPSAEFSKRSDKEKPMIMVDKIIKIGEVDFPRSRLDNHEKLKLIRKKRRESNDLRKRTMRNSVGGKSENHQESNSVHHRNDVGHMKRETPEYSTENNFKPESTLKSVGEDQTKLESNEIKIKSNDSVSETANNGDGIDPTIPKVNNLIQRVVNSTENILNFAGDLIKVMDSMETQFKDKLGKNGKENKGESEESSTLAANDGNFKKKPTYEDIEKNITKLLNQFMVFFKNVDSGKFDADKGEMFDFTLNDTATRNSEKTYGKRFKKNADFAEESLNKENSRRQVTDLNFLFLTVTLPTIIISALLLLVCFFSFQVRGKICTKLFKPRRVLVVEDETSSLSRK